MELLALIVLFAQLAVSLVALVYARRGSLSGRGDTKDMTTIAAHCPLISTAEAADALGVSVETVRRLVDQEILAPVRYSPRSRLRFRRADVEQLREHGYDREVAA